MPAENKAQLQDQFNLKAKIDQDKLLTGPTNINITIPDKLRQHIADSLVRYHSVKICKYKVEDAIGCNYCLRLFQ